MPLQGVPACVVFLVLSSFSLGTSAGLFRTLSLSSPRVCGLYPCWICCQRRFMCLNVRLTVCCRCEQDASIRQSKVSALRRMRGRLRVRRRYRSQLSLEVGRGRWRRKQAGAESCPSLVSCSTPTSLAYSDVYPVARNSKTAERVVVRDPRLTCGNDRKPGLQPASRPLLWHKA